MLSLPEKNQYALLKKTMRLFGVLALMINQASAAPFDAPTHGLYPPMKLAQASWVNACIDKKFNENNTCFAETPQKNSYTKLVLSVTNLYAIANLSLSADYPESAIWIGYYQPGDYKTMGPTTMPSPGDGVQVLCAPYTEIGWPVQSTGINTDNQGVFDGLVTANSQYVITRKQIDGKPLLTMVSQEGITTKTPLYIICIARNNEFSPTNLPKDFIINWK